MNHRERILAAFHHQPVDRIPTDIWATDEVWDSLRAHFGLSDNLGVYDALDIDGIMGISPPYIGPVRPTAGGIEYEMHHGSIAAVSFLVHDPLAETIHKDNTIAGYVEGTCRKCLVETSLQNNLGTKSSGHISQLCSNPL